MNPYLDAYGRFEHRPYGNTGKGECQAWVMQR